MTEWLYKQGVLLEPPPEAIGFVYRITRLDTGRTYIGQKRFSKARTRKPLKGKKRKRRDRVKSDWETYFGSCKELQDEVALLDEVNFRREVLFFCYSKAEMNYVELREQILHEVLIHPEDYYNSYIGTRIHRDHLRKFRERLAKRRRVKLDD